MSDERSSMEDEHQPGVGRGEDMERVEGQEEGLYDVEPTGAGRPAGMSNPRASTGINPGAEDDNNPDSPYLQPA